jgi:hypothetical protein
MEELMEESVLAHVRKVAGPDPADQPLPKRGE